MYINPFPPICVLLYGLWLHVSSRMSWSLCISSWLLSPSFQSSFSLILLSNLFCMQICIYIHIYTPKYKLLAPYNVTCMHVYKADHLVLNNEFVWYALEKATIPTTRFCWFPIVFCAELRPWRIFHMCHVHWCHPHWVYVCAIMMARLEKYNLWCH